MLDDFTLWYTVIHNLPYDTLYIHTLPYDTLYIHKYDTQLHVKSAAKSVPQYGDVWERARLSKLILL